MSRRLWRWTVDERQWLTSSDPVAMLRHFQSDHRTGYGPVGSAPAIRAVRKLRLFACGCCRQVWDGVECRRCRGEGSVIGGPGGQVVGLEPRKRCLICHGTGRVGGLTDPRSRRAVEVSEKYADGEATAEELREADRGADHAAWDEQDDTHVAPCWVGHDLLDERAIESILANTGPPATQARLLRCVAGNPWRPVRLPVCGRCDGDGKAHGCDRPFDWSGPGTYPGPCPVCGGIGWDATYRTPSVHAVARSIYEDRRFEDMPILADALEDAGCADSVCEHCVDGDVGCSKCGGAGIYYNPPYSLNRLKCPYCNDGLLPDKCCKCDGTGRVPHPLLAHCREPGPHVRGCWVVDLVLGKE